MTVQMKFVTYLIMGIGTLSAAHNLNAMEVANLRCEYLTDPVGIDVVQPRLSWVLESDRRGAKQTAYRIMAASSRANIEDDKGDLWDTGKVISDQTVFVVYEGKPMQTGMRVWWKVQVWDENNEVSAFSKPAYWEMGLLKPEDWQAKWISAVPRTKNVLAEKYLQKVLWIWFPSALPQVTAPIGDVFMRRQINIPAGKKI
ncbi:MAG: hypothetical protein JSV03_10680, partial [Planctomycetota bacterium]